MQNPKILAILKGMEDRYPVALERQFPRILKRIAALWELPELDPYFEELLVDKRGGRKGFPPEVVQEIFFLSNLHDRVTGRKREEETEIWELEHARGAQKKLPVESLEKRFFKAIVAGDLTSIKLLTAVDVNVKGEGGWTPLMVALQNRHEGLALLLLNCGADPLASDDGGYTPLHWGAFNGCKRVVGVLLEKGAKIEAKTTGGATPLLLAANRGHAAVVKFLVEKGANVNLGGADGLTALHKAIVSRQFDILAPLLACGAEINTMAPFTGRTPLHEAAEIGDPKIVELLLKRGAKANVRANDGATPLSLARAKGHQYACELLIFVGGAK
ncbi:MAG: ankyrin repeat domain-containing protein [Burkholderiales bacterium]